MSPKAETKPSGPPKGVTPPTGGGPRAGFLSDVIVELGFADREAVEQAVRAARSPGTTVARVLVESGAVTEEQLAHATAERYGIAYIDLQSFTVDPSAANLIKPSAAKRYQAVPVGFVGGGLLVAMADPADALGVNDIAVMTKMDVKPAVAARPALEALLERLPLDEPEAAGAPAAAPDAAEPEPEAAAPEPEEATTASAAVFWQADAIGESELEDPPDEADPAPPGGADQAEVDRLTAELGELRGALERTQDELAGVRESAEQVKSLESAVSQLEAELDDARRRAREGKEASAELAAVREELAAASARLEQAEAAAGEADELRRELSDSRDEVEQLDKVRDKLSSAKGERDEVRARVEVLESALEDAEEQASEAAGKLEAAERAQKELLEDLRALEEAHARIEELEDADRRAEHARQALADLREESDREREMVAINERELRTKLEDEGRRRQELEARLAEVEGSAFAAERAFEELRTAQTRMRGALRALADPDEPDEPADAD